MRTKRRTILLAASVAVVLLTGLAWLILRSHEPPEPVYKGKPLSYWLTGYNQIIYGGVIAHGSPAPTPDQASEAVRQIGTNAIPTLLRMLRERDSKLKLKLVGLVQKQHLVPINFVPADMRNDEAFFAFAALGDQGRNAVPALIQVFEENISESSQNAAATALGWIGPAAATAVPALLRALANTNNSADLRRCTALVLAEIGVNPELVVPILVECLRDPEPQIQAAAASALGGFGSDAKPAVPALLNLLKNPAPGLRTDVERALKSIDPEAAAKAGIK